MFTIDKNSEAGRVLTAVMADENTYKVSIDYRPTARGGQFVAIKKNEGMWTSSLSTITEGHSAYLL